jgi:hypothetical protein
MDFVGLHSQDGNVLIEAPVEAAQEMQMSNRWLAFTAVSAQNNVTSSYLSRLDQG